MKSPWIASDQERKAESSFPSSLLKQGAMLFCEDNNFSTSIIKKKKMRHASIKLSQ